MVGSERTPSLEVAVAAVLMESHVVEQMSFGSAAVLLMLLGATPSAVAERVPHRPHAEQTRPLGPLPTQQPAHVL